MNEFVITYWYGSCGYTYTGRKAYRAADADMAVAAFKADCQPGGQFEHLLAATNGAGYNVSRREDWAGLTS